MAAAGLLAIFGAVAFAVALLAAVVFLVAVVIAGAIRAWQARGGDLTDRSRRRCR